jgi:hypothetical protein
MNGLAQYGAFGFGLVLGWFLYFVNRYRKDDVALTDLTTVIGAVGGAAVTALFGEGKADLFGAYGLGLAVGFFAYFLVLIALVANSANFNSDFFLDGRRKRLAPDEEIPKDVRTTTAAFDDPTPGKKG